MQVSKRIQPACVVPPRVDTQYIAVLLLLEHDVHAVLLRGVVAQLRDGGLVVPVVAEALCLPTDQRTRVSTAC